MPHHERVYRHASGALGLLVGQPDGFQPAVMTERFGQAEASHLVRSERGLEQCLPPHFQQPAESASVSVCVAGDLIGRKRLAGAGHASPIEPRTSR